MKHSAALVLALMLPLGWLPGAAEASGAAVCSIAGTITFSATEGLPQQGRWRIQPAVITCQGIFRAYERITGPGEYTGSGTYTAAPGTKDGCLVTAGSGEVDYRLQTTDNDVHVIEPHEFILAGAGAFSTPTMNGTFQAAPPYEGDCLSKPVTKASFVAQSSLVRLNGIGSG